jgi:hypothetical protein
LYGGNVRPATFIAPYFHRLFENGETPQSLDMTEITNDVRTCPICKRENNVRMNLEWVQKGCYLCVTATCHDCGYKFQFGAGDVLFFSGLIFGLALFFGAIFWSLNIIGACLAGIFVMIFVSFVIALMANASLFYGYIDRQILEKAERMVRKGQTSDSWFGEKYSNKNKLMTKDGIRR